MDLPGTMVIIGLVSVALAVLVGTRLAGRRRRHTDPAWAGTMETDDRVPRRTIHGSVHLADDPILAALRVDEQMRARRDRRAPRVATDERPNRDA